MMTSSNVVADWRSSKGRRGGGKGMSCDFHVYAMRRHSSPLQRPSPLINIGYHANLFFTEPHHPSLLPT
jgi:hypothetical protein